MKLTFKKLLSIVLCLCIILSSASALGISSFAHEADDKTQVKKSPFFERTDFLESRDGLWRYILLEDGTAAIFNSYIDEGTVFMTKAYLGTEECLNIPSEIDGHTVSAIGPYALSLCDKIKEINIPDTVRDIYFGAFSFCNSLEEIEIPSTVKRISVPIDGLNEGVDKMSDGSLGNCKSLKKVVLNEGLTYIGYSLFADDTQLTCVEIPASVTHIDESVFVNCSSLEKITVNENNQYYKSVDGVLYDKDETELIAYPSNKEGTQFTFPDTVRSTHEYAFAFANNLEEVSNLSKLEKFGSATFWRCGNLKSIKLPSQMEVVEDNLFGYCSSLESVELTDNMKAIKEYAFIGCSSLSNITLGKNIERIETGAFWDCSSLKEINFPQTLVYIGGFAFCGCPFEEIKLPDSLKIAGESSFAECKILKKFDTGEGLQYLPSRMFAGCTSLESVNIGSNVTGISGWTFNGCFALTEITIPSNILRIGREAFAKRDENGEGLKKIYGYEGSAAQKYAEQKSIEFVSLGPATNNFVNPYSDVNENDWFYNSAMICNKLGIMTGYSSGDFGPSNALQRQDFVLILARFFNVDLDSFNYNECDMPDVVKGSYYYEAICWAVTAGIIKGYDNGYFGVGNNITREQIATILFRYTHIYNYKGDYSLLDRFDDKSSISPYAVDGMVWAIENGLISGMNPTTLAPCNNATRAEAATIITRAMWIENYS